MCSPWSLGTVAFAVAICCATPEACVSCCVGSGRGHRADQNGPCVGMPEPLPSAPLGCSPAVGCGGMAGPGGLGFPAHPTRRTPTRPGQSSPPWDGEGVEAAPRAHPSTSNRRSAAWSPLSSSASCLTSWPSRCCCPCCPGCWRATAVPTTPSMAPGRAGWTGLPPPSGCQWRRGTTASCSEFLCAPLTGATSDCLGRRPVMLLCLAVIGVAFSLGFTLGPMLGASLPLEMAPWFALLFAASDLLFIFCFLPETLPLEKRAPSIALGFHDAADLLSPLALLRFSAVARGQDPPSGDRLSSLRRLGLVYFLYLFLFSGLEYTLSFLTHQRFQFSSLQQGKMFFLIGLTMATIQGAYARRIHPGGEVAAVKRALLLLVPAFLLIGWGRSLPVLGLGLLLYSFAAAVVVPCLSSVVAGYGSPGQKGTVMGTLRSLGALARAAGPLVAASVYWLAGAQACFTTWSGLFLLPFFLLQKLSYPAQTLKAE
ncbi:major facilitator superfamily domain-containing protein 10 isoform X3 [Symphalangus syndactylus]|uniref:major facilitator superfamily domain-containing protein 10 isoform X3 n=1 Tax=Symphalangus syndactylus TaxID=9590 RepID=UPI0030049C83